MRATKLVVASLALAIPAGADPCEVTIARAPAELRAALDSALAAESHCRVALELRAVPTEGGYYLLARDLHGRTRERIVPDVASATVLVASWAADDELDEPVHVAVAIAPPSEPPIERGENAPSISASTRDPLLGIYGTTGPSGYGVRGEVDVIRRGSWSIGAAAAERSDTLIVAIENDYGVMTPLQTTSADLIGYASYERDLSEAWHVRTTLGAGAEILSGSLNLSNIYISPNGETAVGNATIPLADASVALAADVGHGFSLVFGVNFDAYIVTPELSAKAMGKDAASVPLDGGVWWSLFGGLRYAL
ncbi:MAG TPA: hypothetical protein VGG74_29485 [Kofleriaceae bacterium]|jgi:hypothetical protein